MNILVAHSPTLSRAYPTGANRGSSIELLCIGDRLEKAQTLLFYQKGITVAKPKTIEKKKVTFPITIAKDAPLGEYLYRIQCQDGLSDLRSFWVGPYPSIIEKKESNNSIVEAQEIKLNHTIIGQTTNEDLDFYKIHLKKDQIISMEVEAMRLGRTFYDAFLAIYSSNNTELASSDDSTRLDQDPRLSFKAPHQGDYYILVRDSSYQGNAEARYRLHVGDFIFTRSIYPLGAKKNKPQSFIMQTEHEGAINHQATFTQATKDTEIYPSKSNRTAPSPHLIRVTEFDSIQEIEPNQGAKHQSQTTTPDLPIAFHGTIDSAEDTDWFRFKAKKGQKVRAQVYARSLGSPVDTAIQFRLAEGKYVNNNDDASQGSPDSKIDYPIPADGEYWILVKDQLKRSSPHHHYRIELTIVKPELSANLAHKRIQESQKWKAFNIPQGNSMAYQINLTKSGVKGEVEIISNALPTGISLKKIYQIKNDNKAVIILQADAKAPLNAGIYQLSASSKEPAITTPVSTQVYPFLGGNNRVYPVFRTDKTAIAVTSPVPATLEIIQPQQPIVQSGVLPLTIKAHRKEGFDGDINIEIPWKPAGISANYSLKIPKGKTEAQLQIAADSNSPIGKWDFCVRASFNTKSGPAEICSNLIKIEVKPPYLTGKLELAATDQGANTSIICKLTHSTPFTGKAKLTLHGLPDGILATPVEITQNTKEIIIPITVPTNARIGKHGNLFCRVLVPAIVPQGKKIIPHTIGQGGTLRVNPPAKKMIVKKEDPKTKKTETPKPSEKKKKPLSRLEELRNK